MLCIYEVGYQGNNDEGCLPAKYVLVIPTHFFLGRITHDSVLCGLRKRGSRKQSEYIDRNNKVAIFTHM